MNRCRKNAANTEGFRFLNDCLPSYSAACRYQKRTTSAECEYGLPEIQEIGTAQHFRLSRLQKCCTVPIFLLAWGRGNRDSTALSTLQTAEVLCCPCFFCLQAPIMCCSVPKNLKNQFFQNYQPRSPQTICFLGVLGTVRQFIGA